MTIFLASLFLLLVLFLLGIRKFFYVVTIEGVSMLPKLKPGDRVLILRHYPAQLLKRGQIVVADLSKADSIPSPKPTMVIKRLIGTPGEVVKFQGSQVEPCTLFAKTAALDHEGYFRMQVPSRHYFVQADGQGSDSRHWGPLPFRTLTGVFVRKMLSTGNPSQQVNSNRKLYE